MSEETLVTEPTLAERLYAARKDEDTLFDAVNRILGCDISKCLDDGFTWAATDTFWDDYDGSVEVVMSEDWPAPTDEQALQILALGFGQIYFSQGEAMTQVSRQYSAGVAIPNKVCRHVYNDPRYLRTGDEDNQWRAKCNQLQARLDAINKP